MGGEWLETIEAPYVEANSSANAQLRTLFGDYKAEWLRDRVFDLFTEPDYFPDLESTRPCVLVGARGTGKSTVLRRLSYQGAFHVSGKDPSDVKNWRYIGLYYRINSNRVTAFSGVELNEAQWSKVFGHYVNLVLCDMIAEFLDWYRETVDGELNVGAENIRRVSRSLNVSEATTEGELRRSIMDAVIDFESAVNNIADGMPGKLSLQGAPLDQLAGAIAATEAFIEKPIFFLMDEYESLLPYQQRVINTLIKQAGSAYTFKIGVKEEGWVTRDTLATGQPLVDPADYARINISERLLRASSFKDFAERVCNARLGTIQVGDGPRLDDISTCFQSLAAEQEAGKLGVRPLAAKVRDAIEADLDEVAVVKELARFSDLELYFMGLWAAAQDLSPGQIFLQAIADATTWKTRYSNYRQAVLYAIRRGKTGIRKYYSGWDTIVQVASGNIRYLMELVEECFILNAEADRPFWERFDPDIQTRACQRVGRKNLEELQGMSVEGGRLTRLLLGLGRIFGVLAADPMGHAPEVTQFRIDWEQEDSLLTEASSQEACERLLAEAVMHQVLVRQPGTKLTDEAEVRDYEYRIHPVFSAFFVFPFGRKRRITLRPEQFVRLASEPRSAIRAILAELRRSTEEPLPEHLAEFETFYAAESSTS